MGPLAATSPPQLLSCYPVPSKDDTNLVDELPLVPPRHAAKLTSHPPAQLLPSQPYCIPLLDFLTTLISAHHSPAYQIILCWEGQSSLPA